MPEVLQKSGTPAVFVACKTCAGGPYHSAGMYSLDAIAVPVAGAASCLWVPCAAWCLNPSGNSTVMVSSLFWTRQRQKKSDRQFNVKK